ncbi:hypothetical protein ACFLYO_00675 [Chloroflexota bacterium]
MGLLLGKIVQAGSHIHYVCQIFGKHEVEADQVPQPANYALGSFVSIDLGDGQGQLVGLISNTQLLNPEFGNVGPRLSSEPELQIFTPDYLNERAVLAHIIAIGSISPKGGSQQGVPRLAARAAAKVEQLTSREIHDFHVVGNALNLTYLPLVLTQDDLLSKGMMRIVLERLAGVLPDKMHPELEVLWDDLLWRSQITVLGGGQ